MRALTIVIGESGCLMNGCWRIDIKEWRIIHWGRDHKEFKLGAIREIKSIPFFFWNNLNKLNLEYEDYVDKIEPDDRNDYFEWAYENHYHGWDRGVLEWVQGFHPGRWIIMDMKRGEVMEDIRDLEDYGAYSEERFIRSKDHIEDYLHNK